MPILTSPTTSEESTERRLARPIRGVEAQSEPVPYIRPSEDVDNDQIAEEDSHIDPEMPDISDEDDTYDPPLIKTPAEIAPRRSTRDRKAPDRLNLLCVEDSHEEKTRLLSYHMTARRAMKEIPLQARPAIIDELTNLTKKGVLTGRLWEDLTPNQRKRILRSHTNITHKRAPTSDGTGRTMDKVKARHVANGEGQDRNHYTREETSSPTVSISGLYLSLMTTMHSHKPECVCVTADVGCAYLNAKMPKNDPTKLVHIKIESDIATMLIEVDPTMIPYVRKDG